MSAEQAPADGFPAWYRVYGEGVNIRTAPEASATSVGQLQHDLRILVTAFAVEGGECGALCATQPNDLGWPVVGKLGTRSRAWSGSDLGRRGLGCDWWMARCGAR